MKHLTNCRVYFLNITIVRLCLFINLTIFNDFNFIKNSKRTVKKRKVNENKNLKPTNV